MDRLVLPKADDGISLVLVNGFPKAPVALCCLSRGMWNRTLRPTSMMEVTIWHAGFSHDGMIRKNS